MKSKLYKRPVDSMEELEAKFEAEINGISSKTWNKFSDDMKLRLDDFKKKNERHSENLIDF